MKEGEIYSIFDDLTRRESDSLCDYNMVVPFVGVSYVRILNIRSANEERLSLNFQLEQGQFEVVEFYKSLFKAKINAQLNLKRGRQGIYIGRDSVEREEFEPQNDAGMGEGLIDVKIRNE